MLPWQLRISNALMLVINRDVGFAFALDGVGTVVAVIIGAIVLGFRTRSRPHLRSFGVWRMGKVGLASGIKMCVVGEVKMADG